MKVEYPEFTGRYKVGVTEFIVDTGREETLKLHEGGVRKLSCRMYYPSTAEGIEGKERSEYMSRQLCKAYKVDYDKKMAEGENRIDCYVDAAPVSDEKFPLIIFSHGYGSFRDSNTYMCGEICSQGYVVVIIGHPYETMALNYADGTCVDIDKKAMETAKPIIPALISSIKLVSAKGTDEEINDKFKDFEHKYYSGLGKRVDAWCIDTDDVCDYVKATYSDRIDSDAGVGLTGHSMGGAVAHMLLRKSDKYSCAINIDGGLFGEYRDFPLRKPFMNINCNMNKTTTTAAYLDPKGPVYSAIFKDMRHLGFTDLMFFFPVKSQVGKLPADILHRNLCGLHIRFFDKYIKGKDVEIKADDPDSVNITKKG